MHADFQAYTTGSYRVVPAKISSLYRLHAVIFLPNEKTFKSIQSIRVTRFLDPKLHKPS